MTEENVWLRILAKDPGHSERYVQRFRRLAARGHDLGGEARFVDALLPRGARVLDAGCGTGRVGGLLAATGHRVVGVDLDPRLIAEARAEHPGSEWIVGDLARLDLPGAFHVVVCAGNVMTFVAPSTRVEILRRFRAHLAPGGRVVTGFGSGREYEFDDFLADAEDAGLTPDHLLGTWDLRPFGPESSFLVAVLSLA
ncbi:class I SAM-dependent methyltransferase [Cryptosporangium arvum]|uniref:class I SAM-dependent methyltransferase n=1 Tax=Cryptosporangium arvum TaxID=80871 RepID=UPI0004AC8C25|nr:class I SAM-dependent methyltransferase [Cryptosporangium arvum]